MQINSFTEQNYLKAIYKLSGKSQQNVLTMHIAEQMSTKSATVTDMLIKLAGKKLVEYEKYYGVRLTEKGKHVALNVIRKHRLWEVFLAEKLGFGWHEVHSMAEEMEHCTTDELANRLEKFLGNPKTDPHGGLIPNQKGEVEKQNLSALCDWQHNKQALIKAVNDDDAKFLKYLKKNSLTPGSKIIIKEKNDFDGSIELKVNNKNVVHVSSHVAKNLLVAAK